MIGYLYKKFIYRLIEKYLKSYPDLRFDDASPKEVSRFKRNIYGKRLPYMLNRIHLDCIDEKDLVIRSSLLSLSLENRLAATCRLTPYPFELNSLLPQHDGLFSKYENYLEISRLVCVRYKLLPLFLIHAGNVGISLEKYDGFVALCSERYIGIFKKFGLKEIAGPFALADRSEKYYYVVAAKFEVMGVRALVYLLSKLATSIFNISQNRKTPYRDK